MIRISAGQLRGRRLRVLDVDGLRPTSSRVREAIFNSLASHGLQLSQSRMLDLFAGSGLMGLEALSRGAREVIALEQDRGAIRAMQTIQHDWQLSSWQIQQAVLPKGLQQFQGQSFDWVFADPPYAKGFLCNIPEWLTAQQIRCQFLVVEEAASVAPPVQWTQGWQCLQSRKYGDTCVYYLMPEAVDA